MPARSAALLLYRRSPTGTVEILLVHPGGPLWAPRDEGAWSLPKGAGEPDEDDHSTARREFAEELGRPAPDGVLVELGEVRQAGGKRVVAFAVEGDFDATDVRSNEFEMEWPPRSGRRQSFPEVDRAAWFTIADARGKLIAGQVPLLDRLTAALGPP
ncbi:MAG: NUDIX domain-containing protein [Actinobacteria bacterium]|nr:NUDIX domain-containing protein [Actinomycetota bacterium]